MSDQLGQNRFRTAVLTGVLTALLAGCSSSPMDLVPQSARFLIQSEMRRADNSPSITVEQLLAQARQVGSDQARGFKTTTLTFGIAGLGIGEADYAAFADTLRSGSAEIYDTVEIAIGSRGERSLRGLIFKTFADGRRLKRIAESENWVATTKVESDLDAGLVKVRLSTSKSETDA